MRASISIKICTNLTKIFEPRRSAINFFEGYTGQMTVLNNLAKNGFLYEIKTFIISKLVNIL